MPELEVAIPFVRERVVAVMRLREVGRRNQGEGQPDAVDYNVSFGSGFCVLDDRYVITACHVLNDDQPPTETDKHFAFVVPANGDQAFHFPVASIPVRRPDLDIAVLELGKCATDGVHVRALPLSPAPQADGVRVLTVGFPAPEVHGLSFDEHGDYVGGQFFLKSHGNEGIVAAHYMLGGLPCYELNVGWHHGESGGPVVTLAGDEPAAFSLMQQYRNVQSPHGILPGPHRGLALSVVKQDLEKLGILMSAPTGH